MNNVAVEALVRQISLKLERQKNSVAESELQLAAAIALRDQTGKQADLVEASKKPR